MSKSSLNVRIPEDQHKYLRLKSTHEDIDIQDIVADVVPVFMRHDGSPWSWLSQSLACRS